MTRRQRVVLTWCVLVALAVVPGLASAQATTPSDSVLRRAQRLVAEGQGATGRALVDSVVAQAGMQPARMAEALFWRAALAEQAASAEPDYQRVTVEHALSPWSGEALLRLGQLAYARGERTAALRTFERIVVEQAETPIAAVGFFWKGRALLDQGDVSPACDALREALRRASSGAVELRNQVEFYAQRCREPAVAGGTPTPATAPSAAPAAAPPAAAAPAGVPADTRAATDNTATRPAKASWSLQVSAHTSRPDAARAARTLANRGYQVRVDGTKAPYRVRVGQYATEAEAVKDLARAKKKGLRGARVVRVEAP